MMSWVTIVGARRRGRLCQRLRGAHGRSIFGSAGANNTKREEVRQNWHGFQGDILAEFEFSVRGLRSCNPSGSGALLTIAQMPNCKVQGAACKSIVPSLMPVDKSMIRSCRPPSGRASASISRSVPAVIASIRAPRGMSIAAAASCRPALGGGPLRDILPAMAPSRTANPTTSIMPMTTTRILRPRIFLVTDDARF